MRPAAGTAALEGPALKDPARPSEPEDMRRELSCPTCNADFPLGGDERAGEEVYCSYCGAPCKLTASASSEDCAVEEDY